MVKSNSESVLFLFVLGSARTGLIFTRNQEGAQPGGLAQSQSDQTEPGIPYHVPSCWVPVGGRRGGNSLAARERAAPVLSGRTALWVVRFMLCFLLSCIVVVPVPSVCCSVKLPLSRPTSFLPLSFHSPPHRGGGRGGRMALLLPAAA